MSEISKGLVRHLFYYTPDEPTAIRWKNPPKRGHVMAGDVAGGERAVRSGSANKRRYVQIDGKHYRVMVVVWLMHHDTTPKHPISFVSGDTDYRISNLTDEPPRYIRYDTPYAAYKAKFSQEEWRKKFRSQRVKWNYGLSPEAYQAMLEKQDGVCAICQKPEMMTRHRSHLSVDHHHKTGAVRGLLCSQCNNGLGRFFDDAAGLRRAAEYVEAGDLLPGKHRPKREKSNHPNVTWSAFHRKWRARGAKGTARVHLGFFTTIDEAVAAQERWRRDHVVAVSRS